MEVYYLIIVTAAFTLLHFLCYLLEVSVLNSNFLKA